MSRTPQLLFDPLARARSRLRGFVAESPPDAVATVTLVAGGLLAGLVGFVLLSPLTAVPLVVAAGAAGYGWLRHQALTARALALTTTVVTVLILLFIAAFVAAEAVPVLGYATVELFGVPIPGLGLLTETVWSPVSPPLRYSMVPLIHGTVLVTVIATAVSAPLGVAAALFVSEIAPPAVREAVKPGIEILAGVPSIVYGFIGFTVLSPWASDQFRLVGQGTYLFVGIVVGLMALPTVVSVAEDAIASVPESMKGGSLAIGTTDWQTMTAITLPAAFSGVSAAVLLGVGRAIGETMAATVMLRGTPELTDPLFNVFYGNETLTSLIAHRYGNAEGTMLSALFAAGAILFVTVLALSVASQYIEARMARKFGGEQ